MPRPRRFDAEVIVWTEKRMTRKQLARPQNLASILNYQLTPVN